MICARDVLISRSIEATESLVFFKNLYRQIILEVTSETTWKGGFNISGNMKRCVQAGLQETNSMFPLDRERFLSPFKSWVLDKQTIPLQRVYRVSAKKGDTMVQQSSSANTAYTHIHTHLPWSRTPEKAAFFTGMVEFTLTLGHSVTSPPQYICCPYF